ncbi:MAG: NAD-dependent epimerase/dehydratase family protein [Pirellulales bacterium]
MAKVLVTGASGFIGNHLVRLLRERGDEVSCLVRRTSKVAPLEELGARLVYGDVCHQHGLADAVRDVDVVYHLAGAVRALSLRQLLAVNEGGVFQVAQACAARAQPPTLVVVSSLAAAGPSPADDPRDEARPPAPVSDYGRSKLAGETAARQWAAQVPISIVRPTVVFGSGDRDCLGFFKSIARWRLHVVLGRTVPRISLVHAADLADALVRVAERGERLRASASGLYDDRGVYFVADPRQPTMVELGRLLAEAVGREKVRIVRTPRPGVWATGAVCELIGRVRRRPLPLNMDKVREVLAGSWICRTDRIEQTLGFAPAADLPQRLRETAQWYRCEGWL